MLTVIFACGRPDLGERRLFRVDCGPHGGLRRHHPVTPIGKAASAAIAVVGVITAGFYVGIATRAVPMSLRGHRLTRDSGPDNTLSNRAIWAPRTRLARPDPGPPARQATMCRCIWAPRNPMLRASLPFARSHAAPAMRETRFNAQSPFEVDPDLPGGDQHGRLGCHRVGGYMSTPPDAAPILGPCRHRDL